MHVLSFAICDDTDWASFEIPNAPMGPGWKDAHASLLLTVAALGSDGVRHMYEDGGYKAPAPLLSPVDEPLLLLHIGPALGWCIW